MVQTTLQVASEKSFFCKSSGCTPGTPPPPRKQPENADPEGGKDARLGHGTESGGLDLGQLDQVTLAEHLDVEGDHFGLEFCEGQGVCRTLAQVRVDG